ncbi:MAG: hypothetical protein ACD_40C00213G0045 [uncultured bacterium]|nr:MAG: hypothetical protein ACD_40C00213G0045 [uncultured bacterium]
MRKTFLFVDGSNLYGSQYELFGPDKYLDFSSSPTPTKVSIKQQKYLKNEQYFYRSVIETNKRLDTPKHAEQIKTKISQPLKSVNNKPWSIK